MLPDFNGRLRAAAEVIARVGLNLQRGQSLLIAEPYELQGVARGAEVIVNAVRAAAGAAGCPEVDVIWGDGARLRQFAERGDERGFAKLVSAHAAKMQRAIASGTALLFLQSSQPRLMSGLPADRVNRQQRIAWEHFGPVAQQLVQGATNWTVAPAPIPAWAQSAYADLPSEQRLAALWNDVFAALRVDEADPVAAWAAHLAALLARRDELNHRRHTSLRYAGDGTELTLALPPEHVWCTACLATKSGVPFVANLPTEEIFTAPDKDSTSGTARVARPISYGGAVIEGIELEFNRGRVVRAVAHVGDDLLQRLLDTDDGARLLGEVAIVGNVGGSLSPDLGLSGHKAPPTGWRNPDRLFHHPLLDENAASHVALGESYGFTSSRPSAPALNRSLVHVDLPLAVQTELT
ncbi:MAG: aminopeptidase [Opitutae bacterium]|nr:aminopeptidase [Opitutae bacterium]